MDAYALKLATQAAERLKERIRQDYGDDSQLLADMIEGETDLGRMIERCAEELAAVEGMREGIQAAINRMQDRQERYELQAEKLRAAIRNAMEVAELKKLKTPAATLSIKANPPAVVIVDEELIPKSFVVVSYRIDKLSIKNALKEGFDVPGASLSNQPDSLSVRFT
jgi:Siphovirus Gp157